MEKRNRLDRRMQSPPPDVPNRVLARTAAASALGVALAVTIAVVGTFAGVGPALLLVAGAFSAAVLTIAARLIAAVTAWLSYRTALVNRDSARLNHETAKLSLAAAERRSSSSADDGDSR